MNVQFVPRFLKPALLSVLAMLFTGSLVAQSTVTPHSYVGLSISGTPGNTYEVQYVDTLANSNAWLTLTNLLLPTSPYFFIDTTTEDASKRFYRESGSTISARKVIGLRITGTAGSTNMIQYADA